MLINFISDSKTLSALVRRLKNSNYISLDTESDGLYYYEEKLCLIQIETCGEVYIIDSLNTNITPLKDIFSDKRIEKIFHSAVSDISIIKKTLDVDFYNIFDVMIASKYLFNRGYSLKDLIEKYTGVKISKKYQKFNWSKRPLDKKYLEYAAADVFYLKKIRDQMYVELNRKGVYNQFVNYCQKITTVHAKKKAFNYDRYYSIAKNYGLNHYHTLLFIKLAQEREKIAAKLNIPPFRIINNEDMINIVKNGLKLSISEKLMWIYEVIKNFNPQSLKFEKKHYNNLSSVFFFKDRINILKEWRKKISQEYKISCELLLSKHEMSCLSRYSNIDRLILRNCGIDEERITKYGDSLISFYNEKSQSINKEF